MQKYMVTIQLDMQRVRYIRFETTPEKARQTAISKAEMHIRNPYNKMRGISGNFSGGFSPNSVRRVHYSEWIKSGTATNAMGRSTGGYWGNPIYLNTTVEHVLEYSSKQVVKLS